MRYGNGRWESAQFNSRLQITQIGLGTSQNATNLWKNNYTYGEIDANDNLDTSKNNGSVARQTTSFSGLATPFIQSYKYDSLQRLTEAKEVTGTTQNWIQNFSYDRFGNRTSFNQLIGTTQTNQTPTVDPSNNRLTTGQGFTYDFNGNLITDNQGRQFTFNGDNKQTQVKDANNIVVGIYKYDGSGARIKKITASETTIFVYNAGGKLVAEYSTQTASNPTISYLTSDNLGSPRITTDANGQVVSRRDFMPFGEEISRANYGTDSIRQRFTGYEKDIETGLDFAEARYYNNQHGRFTAVDPLLASGKSANPQTFNRYVYVGNNPVNITDPSGLDWRENSITGGFWTPPIEDIGGWGNKGSDSSNTFSSTHINQAGKVIAIYNDGDLGVYQHTNTNSWDDSQNVLPKSGEGVTKVGETRLISDFAFHDSGGYYSWRTDNLSIPIEPGARIDLSADFDFIFEQKVAEFRGNSLTSLAWNGQHGGSLDLKVDGNGNTRYGVGGRLLGKFISYRGFGNFLLGYLAGLNSKISRDQFMKVAGEYQTTQSIFWAGLVAAGVRNPRVNQAPDFGEEYFSGVYLRTGFGAGQANRPPPPKVPGILGGRMIIH